MIAKIVHEKIYIKRHGYHDFLSNSFCENGHKNEILSGMLDRLIENKTTDIITNEDIKLGFVVHSATVFCLNTPKQLYKFFFDLVTQETPRSILLALVNTVRSTNVKSYSDKLLLNKFYLSLDKVLRLSYGNVLLASSSNEDLQKMMENSWSFFANNTETVDKCLRGEQCQNATELM